jgi:hypothetical protein
VIASVIINNITLTSLNLINNNIGSEGAIMIANALCNNLTIAASHLSNNSTDDKEIYATKCALHDNNINSECAIETTKELCLLPLTKLSLFTESRQINTSMCNAMIMYEIEE